MRAGLLACAVLIHLDRAEFLDVLRRARRAVHDNGLFGFTLKAGDGETWSRAKLHLPRRFVRDALSSTGWSCLSLTHVAGRNEPWLFVLARADREI